MDDHKKYTKTASIIVITRNEASYIGGCLDSLLRQTYANIEVIVVDSQSTDATPDIIREFLRRDRRVRHVVSCVLGFASARNKGLSLASGEYVFFTDADCLVQDDWVEQGLAVLEQGGVSGVSGITYYVSERYKPSVRDKVVYNKDGTVYPTCNIAFKKKELEAEGLFRPRYDEGLEDWDIALRLMRRSRIAFSRKMKVYHCKKERAARFSADGFGRTKSLVYLIRDHHGDKRLPRTYLTLRVVQPLKLMIMICPPLLFIYYLYARSFNIFKDIRYIAIDYYNCVIGRLVMLDGSDPYGKLDKFDFKRIWLVSSSWEKDGNLNQHAQGVREWLGGHYSLLESEFIDGIYIDLYSRQPL